MKLTPLTVLGLLAAVAALLYLKRQKSAVSVPVALTPQQRQILVAGQTF